MKFSVIHELERHMPAAIYDYEWKKAGRGKGKAYHPLSHLERWIPIIFLILYTLLVIIGVWTRLYESPKEGGPTPSASIVWISPRAVQSE